MNKEKGYIPYIILIVLTAIIAVLVLLFFQQLRGRNREPDTAGELSSEEALDNNNIINNDNEYIVEETSNLVLTLNDYNQTEYEKAKKGDNLIMLYFYAKWCPSCRREIDNALLPALSESTSNNIVAFGVNFNDDDTNSNEKEIAEEFGVLTQHTKVFIKDGKMISMFSEEWNKAKFLQEFINNLLPTKE